MSDYFTGSCGDGDAANINPYIMPIRVCSRCSLHKTRTYSCPGFFPPVVAGDPPLEILFVGRNPGADEDSLGRPFVGRSGKFLMKMIKETWPEGERPGCAFTNLVKCYTEENRPPTGIEIASCETWLQKELAFCNPKVVVLLGNEASSYAFPGKKIGSIAGSGRVMDGRVWISCYHPAAALRGHDVKESIKQSLELAKDILDGS